MYVNIVYNCGALHRNPAQCRKHNSWKHVVESLNIHFSRTTSAVTLKFSLCFCITVWQQMWSNIFCIFFCARATFVWIVSFHCSYMLVNAQKSILIPLQPLLPVLPPLKWISALETWSDTSKYHFWQNFQILDFYTRYNAILLFRAEALAFSHVNNTHFFSHE